MKKNILTLVIMSFVLFTLCGCGKEKITVTGQDGTEYESYQECCAAEDFQAAHQFLAKMENSRDWEGEMGKAKNYVFKQEALFLMSQYDETSKKRIIYLLKEYGKYNALVSQLIDIAIDDDDEAFVRKLATQYSSGADHESLKKLFKYLTSKGTDENKDFLISLFERIEDDNTPKLYEDLEELANKMGDKELAEKLSNMNSYKLSIASSSIEGILNGFFVVMDSKAMIYAESDGEKYIKIKIKKVGMPKVSEDKYYVRFYLDIMDKDDISISNQKETDVLSISRMKEMKVGDTEILTFKVNYKKGIRKLKVRSE